MILDRPAFPNLQQVISSMSEWLEAGDQLPKFSLRDDAGNQVESTRWSGRPLVLYFYPKDDTPGCTKQACAFRDSASRLQEMGVAVVGISCDTAESHAKFRDKYSLNFPLLVDQDHQFAERLGAWREKNMYGKKSMGIQRSTFLVDASGTIVKVWKRVRVDGHVDQVLAAIEEQLGGASDG